MNPTDSNPNFQSAPQTALLPKGLLAEDEQVFWLARPSLWFLILPALRIYVLPVIAGIAAIALGGINANTPLMLAGLLLVIALRMGVQWLFWVNRVYAITDRQAVMITGLLSTQTVRIPLDRIQHTAVHRSFLEQLTDTGTVTIATAGTSFSEIVWPVLNEPYEVQNIVQQATTTAATTTNTSSANSTFNTQA